MLEQGRRREMVVTAVLHAPPGGTGPPRLQAQARGPQTWRGARSARSGQEPRRASRSARPARQANTRIDQASPRAQTVPAESLPPRAPPLPFVSLLAAARVPAAPRAKPETMRPRRGAQDAHSASRGDTPRVPVPRRTDRKFAAELSRVRRSELRLGRRQRRRRTLRQFRHDGSLELYCLLLRPEDANVAGGDLTCE